MLPPCSELEAAIALDRGIPRATFELRLDPIGEEASGWVADMICRDCGQRWWLERSDGRADSFAIKAPPDGPWNQALVREAKIDYLRRARGEDPANSGPLRDCHHRAL